MGTPTVYPGASGSIKVYAFNNSASIGFLLINKDINPNASGVVQINIVSSNSMQCLYMTASSLTSSDLTLGGYSFIGNNAAPQGNYSQPTFNNSNNQFTIPLNYSQVAYCSLTAPNLEFKKAVYSHSQLYLPLLIVVLLFFL
jgi:hypothetical protein